MSSELYRDVIMKYFRDQSHAAPPETYSHSLQAKNPLCGDDITLYVSVEEGVLRAIGYSGKGCSISLAAGSMLCSAVEGMKVRDALALTEQYLGMFAENGEGASLPEHPDLEAMQAVKKYPGRIACARLAWDTLKDMFSEAGQ